MACYYPQPAYRRTGEPVFRPCGGCIGCRLEYGRQWAIRCVHEAQMHTENCFVTLTYNNEHLPENGSLVPRHLQNFMKYLRKSIAPKEVRFYACGEYGAKLGRPHYHVCLFGYIPDDLVVFEATNVKILKGHRVNWQKADPDYLVYTSESIAKLWNKGFHTVGEITFESAAYAARYVTKKIKGNAEMADKHYRGKVPEFARMSRRPGIGKPWFDKYKGDVYPKDFITLRGFKMQPPTYYDELLKKADFKLYEQIKEKRYEKQRYEYPTRNWQRDKWRKKVTAPLKERRLENEGISNV